MMQDMDHILMVLLVLLWSSGFQAEEVHDHAEPVRLVGGDSRCAGTLELKHLGEWRPVTDSDWTLKTAAVVCRDLDCGSAVSIERREESSDRSVWRIRPYCVQSGSSLKDCATPASSLHTLNLTCSDSVRLVDGTSLCSGRLEVKTDQSNQTNQTNQINQINQSNQTNQTNQTNQSDQSDQRWSSVCEADFDQQDAEVVCRELGCGAPSVLQGALYGEVEAPTWTKEFQCGGHESALLDCRSSGSTRNICSPGKAVGLTCSEPVRLVGGDSRCAGTLELKLGEWRPVSDYGWTLKEADVVCRDLDCGSAVSIERTKESSDRSVWSITSDCVQSRSALKDCVTPASSLHTLNLTCSDLVQPNISVSSMDGVSEDQQEVFQVTRGFNFTISCSIQPQYPGGSFLLTFTSSTSAHNYTQTAVNHSAHFLFPAADPAHQGDYCCVYHVNASFHKFSSESRQLTLSVSELLVEKESPRGFPPVSIFTVVLLVLTLTLSMTAIYFCCKANRGQTSQTQMDTELSTRTGFNRTTSESDGMKGTEN